MSSGTALRVLGISGSLRASSYNTAALRVAAEVMPADMTLEIAEIGDIPHYNADDEQRSGFPSGAARLRSQIGASDALLFATPEYNYSIPGVLKNAIDWASRPPNPPINLKPTAVLGAGGRLGTARAQQHFRNIALHNDLRVVQKPEVLIADLWDKFDDSGRLVDERTRDQIRRLVLALRDQTLDMRAARKRILVVGRDPAPVEEVTSELRSAGYEPTFVPGHEPALQLLNPGCFAALIIHRGLDEASREKLLAHASHDAQTTAVAVVDTDETVLESLESAIAARRSQ